VSGPGWEANREWRRVPEPDLGPAEAIVAQEQREREQRAADQVVRMRPIPKSVDPDAEDEETEFTYTWP
jgi:hypothetical protein